MREHPIMDRVAVTGARGTLGRALLPLLADRNVRTVDRADGIELEDRAALRAALRGCAVVIHLAALHPLVAPPDADVALYERANVVPFRALLEVAHETGVRHLLLASSTSVWRDAAPGKPTAFYESDDAPNADDPYALSKRSCERLLAESGFGSVVLRLARFARAGDEEDEVRKLYRAVDVRDAADAFALALDRAPSGAVFSISAPTPFRREDATDLARDPRAVIRLRTGHDPAWAPARIGSVVTSERARAVLGWRARCPSTLLQNC
jgi:nucleoside-diphosphate-sugar epimerase